MPMHQKLTEVLQDFMCSQEVNQTESHFDKLALQIFSYQMEFNAPYRNFVEYIGAKNVTHWRSIPALPTDAFKLNHLPLRTFPEAEISRYFLTSGTTQDVKGRHEFRDTALYENSILQGWEQMNLPEIHNPYFLFQVCEQVPHSSLGWMFQTLGRDFSRKRFLIDEHNTIDQSSLMLEKNALELFSTALGLLHFMEQYAPLHLPEGSFIFETGGYKGVNIAMEPEAFRAKVSAFFHIPLDRILNEYSMTELSSQFYRWGDSQAHSGPPWTRIRVIDPETGLPASDNQMGYLEILDLANLNSVMAIRTQDLAIRLSDRSFQLIGRDPSAIPRGCSRATDAVLQRR